MQTNRRRRILIGVVSGVLIVGGVSVGIALAADPPAAPTPVGDRQSHVARLAKNLGVDEQKLTDAMAWTHDEMLDEAVQSGRLTKEQAEQMRGHMVDGACDPAGGMMTGDLAGHMSGTGGTTGAMMGGVTGGDHAEHHGGAATGQTEPTN